MLDNIWKGLAIIYASNKEPAEKIYNLLRQNNVPASLFPYQEVDFENVWKCYDGIIFVMALGGVVRTVCKYVTRKDLDPPVIAIDDSLNYVIPVLGAHWGANEIAKELSVLLGSQLIMTTATELNALTPIEYIAKRLLYKIENVEGVVKVDSAIVKDKRVCILGIDELPAEVSGNFSTRQDDHCEVIVITKEAQEKLKVKGDLVLSPIYLSIGVGLKREASLEKVKEAILFALRKLNVGLERVKVISSIKERVAEVAKELGIPFRLVSVEEINSFYDPCISPQSEKLKEIRLKGVAEISALIAGGKGSSLILRKIPYEGEVTVAVATYEG